MSVGTAPGKVILFGEHAVVYGRPAIAVPVPDRRAVANVRPGPPGRGVLLIAEDLDQRYRMDAAPQDDPLAHIVRLALRALRAHSNQDLWITVRSTIPIAAGMGSGAAVSAAIVRALANHFGAGLTPDEVSDLVFQTELLHHGTPSGIDNTVVAYEQPVYFKKGHAPVRFVLGRPIRLAIGDTGVPSPTKAMVEGVRQRWEVDPARYNTAFDAIGRIADRARDAMASSGDHNLLGELMDRNQELLAGIGVSSPQLDGLVAAARRAGAIAAKLSGAGGGGNMIALVTQATAERVAASLRRAGATGVIITEVGRRSSSANQAPPVGLDDRSSPPPAA